MGDISTLGLNFAHIANIPQPISDQLLSLHMLCDFSFPKPVVSHSKTCYIV